MASDNTHLELFRVNRRPQSRIELSRVAVWLVCGVALSSRSISKLATKSFVQGLGKITLGLSICSWNAARKPQTSATPLRSMDIDPSREDKPLVDKHPASRR